MAARNRGWFPLVLLLSACGGGEPEGGTSAHGPPRLGPGVVLERHLAAGERHTYLLTLSAGDFLHLEVDQKGVDAVARLLAPEGGTLLEEDSPSDDLGAEILWLVAAHGGEHVLEVEGLSGQGGRYEVRVATLRPATTEDRSRAQAAARFAAASRFAAAGDGAAEATFHRAGEIWRELGDRAGQGHVEDRLGRLASQRRRHSEAALHHRRAALHFEAAGLERWRGISLSALGTAHYFLGELRAARECFEEALALRIAAGDTAGEAALLHNLGDVHQLLGEPGRALELYEGALERRRRRGEAEPDLLHNLGVLLLTLGRPRDALDRLEEAEDAARRAGDRGRWAGTLLQIGRAHTLLAEPGEAAAGFEHALKLARELRDRRRTALALSNLAVLALRQGKLDLARRRHQEALAMYRELGHPLLEAAALTSLGTVALAAGDPAEAELRFESAAKRLPAGVEPSIRSAILLGQARVAALRGRLEAALLAVEEAQALAELPREFLDSPTLAASYSATARPVFELWVDILMALHRRQPGAGWERRAFLANERGRARSFLHAAALGRAGPAASSASAGPEAALRSRLNALEAQRLRLAVNATSEALTDALEREIRQVLRDLDRLERQLRARDPRRAAVRRLDPLSADEIQRHIPADGALLEFSLGAERSFLWEVTATGLRSHELPGRRELESAARKTYEWLRRSHRREAAEPARQALCRLSQMLLAPATEALARKRLLVVAEEALLYLPFAAFPHPVGAGKGECSTSSLAATHAVSQLPSASLLAALSPPRAGRHWQGELAVIGDPAFAPGGEFAHLPFSRQETTAILRHTSAKKASALVGFEANKKAVLSGRLRDFRRLHFATHGVVSGLHPELSGLVLSTVDEAGQARDGMLWAHEIAGLDLPAELVVLSACRTALGVEMPGEGLVGLSRGFFEAGAANLLVSLWSVDDRSTAELMRRFYGELFAAGRSPAEALARAQTAMAAEPAWRAPYHWAGFVLQGAPH